MTTFHSAVKDRDGTPYRVFAGIVGHPDWLAVSHFTDRNQTRFFCAIHLIAFDPGKSCPECGQKAETP